MSEFAQQPTKLDIARAEFLATLSKQPEELDPWRRSFEDAMRFYTGSDTELGNFIDTMITYRRDIEPSVLLIRLLRNTSNALRGYDDYPREFDKVEAWIKCYEYIYANSRLKLPFEANVELMPLQSNISDRYKGLKYILLLLEAAGRIDLSDPDSCNIVDVGSSAGLGSKMLIGGPEKYQFGLPRYLVPGAKREHGPVVHETRMATAHRLLQRQLQIGHIIGVDVFNPRDTGDFIRACSFEPAELMDPERVRLYDELNDYQPPNLHFINDAFGHLNLQEFAQRFSGLRPQIVHFSSSYYESDHAEQAAMLDQAMEMATELVVVQDYLRIRRGKIETRRNWRDDPYPYRTAVIDMREPERGPQEILKWPNSRLMEAVVGLGSIATAGSGHISFRGLLRSAYITRDYVLGRHDIQPRSPHVAFATNNGDD